MFLISNFLGMVAPAVLFSGRAGIIILFTVSIFPKIVYTFRLCDALLSALSPSDDLLRRIELKQKAHKAQQIFISYVFHEVEATHSIL